MRVLKQTRLQWKHHVCEASDASKWHTRLCNVLLCWTLLTKKRHIKNIHAQLTSLMGLVGHSLGLYVGPSLELYVGSLQVSRGLLYPAWGRMLATYRSYGACWTQLGAACWQPTGLMGLVGPSLGLYVCNLQVLWGLLYPAWGCMLVLAANSKRLFPLLSVVFGSRRSYSSRNCSSSFLPCSQATII